MSFYEQLYQKQSEKGTRILEKRNVGKVGTVEINEPVVYFEKNRIRKSDPFYDKVQVEGIDKHKIKGIREKTKTHANIHARKVKPTRKKFPSFE